MTFSTKAFIIIILDLITPRLGTKRYFHLDGLDAMAPEAFVWLKHSLNFEFFLIFISVK